MNPVPSASVRRIFLWLVKCLLHVATDHHTDGRQTSPGPVHHVEEKETGHRDEVGF